MIDFGILVSEVVVEISERDISTFADRLNLITGTMIISWGIYLRFVASERVGWAYEYIYLITGALFVVRGLVVSGVDPTLNASTVRILRQIAVLILGWVMFRYLIGTTKVKPPAYRIPQVVRRIRNEGINGRRVNYRIRSPLGRGSEDDHPDHGDDHGHGRD